MTLYEYLSSVADLPDWTDVEVSNVDSRSLFGDSPLHVAAVQGNEEAVCLLLAAGADINAEGEHGYTPLHEAIEQGNIAVVKLLIERGASLNIKNQSGDDALNIAEIKGNEEVIAIIKNAKV